jgi:hypothetical protein
MPAAEVGAEIPGSDYVLDIYQVGQVNTIIKIFLKMFTFYRCLFLTQEIKIDPGVVI